MIITAADFVSAFRQEWARAVRPPTGPYVDRPIWGNFIMGQSGLLEGIKAHFTTQVPSLTYKQEFRRFDAAYIGGKDLFGKKPDNPSEVHVLIEHEMGNIVEEEMFKLIYWRAPLKVLMTYDYADSEKITHATREWGKSKLTTFWNMLHTVNSHHNENTQTEYLFLIAQRAGVASHISRWLWARSSSPQLQPV